MPLKEHMHQCKEVIKALQQGDTDTEKLDKSRSAMQLRVYHFDGSLPASVLIWGSALLFQFGDYLTEFSEGMKKCSEAAAEAGKLAGELKAKEATESITSPPLSPSSHRLSAAANSGRVFGRSLLLVLDEAQSDIPPVLEKMALWIEMNGMQTIGLFRIAGTASVVKSLRLDIDTGDDVDFPSSANAHVMCSLFKAYLRELPEPLIPPELFDRFTSVLRTFCRHSAWRIALTMPSGVEEADLAKQNATLQELVATMPKQHAVVLDWLVAFLKRIAAGSEVTKMPAKSLACLISPNIMYKPTQPATVEDGSFDFSLRFSPNSLWSSFSPLLVNSSNLVVELLMERYIEAFSGVTYATKSQDPLEKSAAAAVSKNRSTHSDSLESSRRASDTDIIAPLRAAVTVDAAAAGKPRRRSSHRRIESDSVGMPSATEDAGFLSDGTPSRTSSRRISTSTSQRESSRTDAGSPADSVATSSGSSRSKPLLTTTVTVGYAAASSAPSTPSVSSPVESPAAPEKTRTSSSGSSRSKSGDGKRVDATAALASPSESSRRLSANEKPRGRRGSDAGHSRSRKGSKPVPPMSPDSSFVKSPSSDNVARIASNPATTVADAVEGLASTKLEPVAELDLKQPVIVAPPPHGSSPPHSPSTSDSGSGTSKDAARQRVSALLGTDSPPGSPKTPGSARMKAMLDLVDESRKGDGIGGVAVVREDSLTSSAERRRRSNSVGSVTDTMISSRSKGKDRTAGLTTLTMSGADDFNAAMDSLVRLEHGRFKVP